MVLALQEAGYRVVVLDNLSRGHARSVGAVPLIVADLCSPAAVDSALATGSYDVVMHFAALAYVGESVTQPELYFQNNVVGTLNLLAAMRRHGVDKFVFSSSCATYGEPDRVPIDESHPQRPINPYGRTKLIVEQILADYALAYGLRSVSLRYFNAAGADEAGRVGEDHAPETHLIPLILAEAMRIKNGGDPANTNLQVFGHDFNTEDGSCVRDYIHVTDLCQAHLLAVDRLLSNQGTGAEYFNLANGLGFSVLQVIEACQKVTGQPIRYQLAGRRSGDPATLIGDARLAEQVLGWRPEHAELNDIIASAWAWMNRGQGS